MSKIKRLQISDNLNLQNSSSLLNTKITKSPRLVFTACSCCVGYNSRLQNSNVTILIKSAHLQHESYQDRHFTLTCKLGIGVGMKVVSDNCLVKDK